MANSVKLSLLLLLSVCCYCSSNSAIQCNIAEVCVTDLSQTNCPVGQFLVPGQSVGGCCPACISPPVPPGLCTAPYNCLPDGRFAPVQCKGDIFTGRCFCSNENGERIFGQMWRNEEGANEMTCACSRRRSELAVQDRSDISIHCTSTGDYEPLQCDSGLCWCVVPRTGQPTVSPVPEQDMTRLPCCHRYAAPTTVTPPAYHVTDNAAELGEQYLRRCESTVHALATIHKEQTEHGTHFIGNPSVFCDFDGSYAPFQIRGSQVFCTGREDNILGAWQVDISNMAGMNCNCARDTVVHFPEKGMTVSEVCNANGNYRPNQVSGDRYYCVDSDGYPTTDFMDDWPADNCAEFM